MLQSTPPVLQDPRHLARALTFTQGQSRGMNANNVRAPAVIGPVASLAPLDRTSGASAALASLFPDKHPVQPLTLRACEAIRNTGQRYVNHTAVLVRPDRAAAMEAHYRALGTPQDVTVSTPAAIHAENERIAALTKGLIQGQLTADPDRVLAIVNTQYLKAEWGYPFDPGDTCPRLFTTAAGIPQSVDTLQRTFSYYPPMECMEQGALQAVKLPYIWHPDTEERLSMLLVMKKDGRLQQPDQQDVEQAMSGLVPHVRGELTQVRLPKFRVESKTNLMAVFAEVGLGAALALDPARLPGAVISEFSQRCLLSVDEYGTEAAAVTDMECTDSVPPQPSRTFWFDQPFSAFVCLEKSGRRSNADVDFLFAAQINDPCADRA